MVEKLRKNSGRGGKKKNFRVRRSEKGEGSQGVGGEARGREGERPTPCPSLINKNQVQQEYSGLR